MMDAVSLLLAALVAGAAEAAKDTSADAVKATYRRLKALIHQRLEGDQTAEAALASYEEQPEVWQAPLRDALEGAGIDQDKELVATAQRLLTLVNPQQAAQGKYNVQIIGDVRGFVQGDNADITMNFGSDNLEEK